MSELPSVLAVVAEEMRASDEDIEIGKSKEYGIEH